MLSRPPRRRHVPCPAPPRQASRRRLIGAAGLLAAPWLAGCSAPRPPLRTGCLLFPGYELLFLARTIGALDPAVVRLIEMPSSTDTQQAMAGGQLEAAAMTLDELIVARAGGLDLQTVAVLNESAGADAILARPPLRSLRQLAGHRVGVEASAVGGLMLAAALAEAGLSPSAIDTVPIRQGVALREYAAKRVDAVVTAEPWVGQLEALGAQRLFDSRALPGRIVDLLAVRSEAIRDRPQDVRVLVAAHFTGLAHWQRTPEVAATQMAARLGMAAAEVPAAFRGLHLPDAAENRSWLSGDRLASAARDLQALMLERGLLSRPPPSGPLADPRFLP